MIVVSWPGKLESKGNARGQTRFMADKVAALRNQARLLVAPAVRHWTVPDPTKLQRAAALVAKALRAGKKPRRYPLEPVTLTTALEVTMVRVAPSTLDVGDNLPAAFKAVRDGIADALGSDDRNPLIVWGYGQRKGAPAVRQGRKIVVPAEWGVEVRIQEAP